MLMGLVLSLSLFVSSHAATFEHDTFLLDRALRDLGYSSWKFDAAPLKSESDLNAAIRGNPNQTVPIERFEWPFPQFAANLSLTMVAVQLNPMGFNNIMNAHQRVIIFDLSNGPGMPLTRLYEHQIEKGYSISRLRFMSESLLRIELRKTSLVSHKYQPAKYRFLNIDSRIEFSVDSYLPFRDVEHIQALSDDLYVVAHRGFKGSIANPDLILSVVTFNPVTRSLSTLFTSKQHFSILQSLFYSIEDLPGRSIYQLAPHETKVFLNVAINQRWHSWVLHRAGTQGYLGPQRPMDENQNGSLKFWEMNPSPPKTCALVRPFKTWVFSTCAR